MVTPAVNQIRFQRDQESERICLEQARSLNPSIQPAPWVDWSTQLQASLKQYNMTNEVQRYLDLIDPWALSLTNEFHPYLGFEWVTVITAYLPVFFYLNECQY